MHYFILKYTSWNILFVFYFLDWLLRGVKKVFMILIKFIGIGSFKIDVGAGVGVYAVCINANQMPTTRTEM